MPVATTIDQAGPTAGATIRGIVHGGQNPIVGAHVYLYAVNNTGWAGPGIAASSTNQSVSLLNSSVAGQTPAGGQDGNGNWYATTDSNGDFTITNDYTCPSSYSNLYLLAIGGDAQVGAGNNSAILMGAGVSGCNSSDYVVINEVSSVAYAFAYAGFVTDPTHVSSSSSSLAVTGRNNAGATLDNLMTRSTGVANSATAGGNGTVPQAEINTLANILAACVNSTGPTSSQCTTLFSNAKNGSTTPGDTGTAIVNISHNPGANIANLFGLQSGSPPFQPDLATAPNDFTIAISYTGGGLSGPWGIAVNNQDDILVTNYEGTSVSVFDPLGVPISSTGVTGNGISQPYGIAIDGNGYVWVASSSPSALSSFSSAGTAVTNITSGGLDTPENVVIDASNNVWVDSYANNGLSKFTNSSGTPTAVTGSPFGTSVLNFPYGLAIDTSGNVWVSNKAGTPELVEFNNAASSDSTYTGGGLGGPTAIGFDPSGNAWVTDEDNAFDVNGSALSKFSSSGTAITGGDGYVNGGLVVPYGIAVDSNGNVFAANAESASPSASYYDISEFNSLGTAVSPAEGYQSTSLNGPHYLAIDGSGNLWVTNFTSSPASITEFVGIAAPVVTPIAANLQSPYASNNSAVNRP